MSSPYFTNKDDLFLAALAAIPGLGPKRLSRLFLEMGSWHTAFFAPLSRWEKLRLPAASLAGYQIAQTKFDENRLVDYLQSTQTTLLTRSHPDYPIQLSDLGNDAPLLLYARGNLTIKNNIISVVGSRNPSLEGIRAATKLVPALVKKGFCITSGLASGLDTAAHRLTINTGGLTIAIIGSGLDNIYPRTNIGLAKEIIASGGLLISEYPPLASPLKSSFITRNRLLAALAEKLLVLEADLASGSMRTARLAQSLGRPIFVATNNTSSGCLRLIAEGATPISEKFGIRLTAQV